MKLFSLFLCLFCHALAVGAPVKVQKPERPVECDERLVVIHEDPFTTRDMQLARSTARQVAQYLEDWSYRVDELNPTRVNKTLKGMRAAQFNLDSDGFRDLFLVTMRFLLASKGAEGRLRPISEVLQVSEGETRLLVNFIAQVDVLASQGRMNRDWPAFLRLSTKPAEFFQNELGPHLPAVLNNYLLNTFANVLGDRLRYSRLSINSSANQLKVRSAVGIYYLNFHRGKVLRRSIAPVYVKSTDAWGKQNDRLIFSQVDLAIEDEESRSFLRTMVRADAFFHPHLIPPTFELYPQPAKLSEIQEDAVNRLSKLDHSLTNEFGPHELGLIMPTGEGKTVVVAEFIKRLEAEIWKGQTPRIILVVENVQILQQTVEAFQRDLGLHADKIAMLFGEPGETEIGNGVMRVSVKRGSSLSPPSDFELLVVTRSTFHQRLSSFEHWIAREKNLAPSLRHPFVVIVDEAHHIGTEYGQFETILNLLRSRLDIEDRILMLSATMWHPDKDIIRDVLHGQVTGTHLLEDELKRLQAGQDLETLARTQFLRATVDGYVGPIDDRSFSLENKKWNGEDISNLLKVYRVADKELYTHVTDLIREMRTPGIMDRYVIFEVRQDRAQEGAEYVMEQLGGPSSKASEQYKTSWFLHSQLASDEQNRRMDWFRDRGDFRGSRHTHKYLTTVSQLLEGVDIRGINGIVIMRNLANNRLAQQVLGRGARLEPFKTGVRLIDVPGRIISYLEQAGSLWDEGRFRKLDLTQFGKSPREPIGHVEEREREERDLELMWRPIKMEPALRRERNLLIAWKDVTPEEIVVFHSPRGAAQLLGYNFKRGVWGPTVKLQSWFDYWIGMFPLESREAWREQWAQIKLSDEEIQISSLGGEAETQALRAFHLLAKMFNGLSKIERVGFAQIADGERYLRTGQARVMAALDPRFSFLILGGLNIRASALPHFSELTKNELDELLRAFAGGDLFGGQMPPGFMTSLERQEIRSPGDVLESIEQLLPTHKQLDTAFVRKILKAAHQHARSSDPDLVNTYYLGLLVNHFILAANLSSQKPWNLNGYYGLTPDETFSRDEFVNDPTEFDVWSLLDLAEYRLKTAGRADRGD